MHYASVVDQLSAQGEQKVVMLGKKYGHFRFSYDLS